jgi:hypothetical protein
MLNYIYSCIKLRIKLTIIQQNIKYLRYNLQSIKNVGIIIVTSATTIFLLTIFNIYKKMFKTKK